MSEKKFEVYDLKVNQITEALGMDVEKPVFSWKQHTLPNSWKQLNELSTPLLIFRIPF